MEKLNKVTNIKLSKSSTIQSVDRALDILTLLCKSNLPLSVSEIADELGLKRSTANGLVNTLVQNGFVEKHIDRGKYVESIKLFVLSQNYPNKLPILNKASEYWINIGKRLDVSIHMGLYDEMNEVLFIRVYEKGQLNVLKSHTSFPMHTTGIGKCILSYFPQELVEDIIKQAGMSAYTKNTITDFDILLDELENIRKRGYALDKGELFENTYCVSFPVFDHNNEIVASFSASDTKEKIESMMDVIVRNGLQASKSCSRDLGWKPGV